MTVKLKFDESDEVGVGRESRRYYYGFSGYMVVFCIFVLSSLCS